MIKNMTESKFKNISNGLGRTRQAPPPNSMNTKRIELRQKIGKDSVTIAEFIAAIMKLQSDPPNYNSTVWYDTQKEHWLGWLSQYNGPGAYGRKSAMTHDAKYAYNHIVNYKMLLWIIEAAGVDPVVVSAALDATVAPKTLQAKSAALRKEVSWDTFPLALWG